MTKPRTPLEPDPGPGGQVARHVGTAGDPPGTAPILQTRRQFLVDQTGRVIGEYLLEVIPGTLGSTRVWTIPQVIRLEGLTEADRRALLRDLKGFDLRFWSSHDPKGRRPTSHPHWDARKPRFDGKPEPGTLALDGGGEETVRPLIPVAPNWTETEALERIEPDQPRPLTPEELQALAGVQTLRDWLQGNVSACRRDVLMLCFEHPDWSARRIGDRLGITRHNVNAVKSQARKIIRGSDEIPPRLKTLALTILRGRRGRPLTINRAGKE